MFFICFIMSILSLFLAISWDNDDLMFGPVNNIRNNARTTIILLVVLLVTGMSLIKL